MRASCPSRAASNPLTWAGTRSSSPRPQGDLHTLVNRCRHRGASLCEQRTGQSNGFTCPYHAWSYGLDGTLRGIPYPDGYEELWARRGWGSEAPYRGLRRHDLRDLRSEAEPLEEFLGDAKVWIDRFLPRAAAIR